MNIVLARTVPAARVVVPARMGVLPVLALGSALGLLLIALGDTLARQEVPAAPLVWWIGLGVAVVPSGVRLVGRDAGRDERLGLVLVVGLALYIVKVLHGPSGFVLFDEFLHWATLADINETGRLFHPNNLLVASPHYPGLEVVADLLMRAGLSAWDAAILVVGAARILLMLGLFLLYERVGHDARLAGIAALVYAANPGFLFFDAQFAYESLALPMAVLVLWAALRREPQLVPRRILAPAGLTRAEAGVARAEAGVARAEAGVAREGLSGAGPAPRSREGAQGMTVIIVLAMAAVVVTHHVTSIALCVFLATWATVSLIQRRRDRPGSADVGGLALTAIVMTVAWTLYVASVTVDYLGPALGMAIDQVLELAAGGEGARELFRSATGATAPLPEQIVAYGSVVILLLALPLGLRTLWRRLAGSSAAVALGLVALAYPLTLVARLTARGAELSARSAEFVFVGLAFVVGLALVTAIDADRAPGEAADPDPHHVDVWRPPLPPLPPPPRRRGTLTVPPHMPALTVVLLVVLIGGGAVLGLPAWARLPGPYLVSADPRSIEPVGIAAARWAAAHLGVEQRFLADRINRVLLATYGRQHPISAAGDRVDVKVPYFATALTATEQELLARAGVRYVISDLRLPTSLPWVGVYVERGELTTFGSWTEPMQAAALEKWDTTSGSMRIYDAGDIRIHDIEGLTGAAR